MNNTNQYVNKLLKLNYHDSQKYFIWAKMVCEVFTHFIQKESSDYSLERMMYKCSGRVNGPYDQSNGGGFKMVKQK